jgi:hypothetical protein
MDMPRAPGLIITEFDIVSFKLENVYVARAIVYGRERVYHGESPNSSVPINDHQHWKPLIHGRSEDGFLNALEKLWNTVQSYYDENFLQGKWDNLSNVWEDPTNSMLQKGTTTDTSGESV